MTTALTCRSCNATLSHTFADLGMSPISNAFLKPSMLRNSEKFYPLHAYVCSDCLLVQLEEVEAPTEIFNNEYAYFSSYSLSWLAHAQRYAVMMTSKLQLDTNSQVIEIASNDGYLLQYFQAKNIPVLGIEPAGNVAAVAESKGINSLVEFFSVATAQKLVGQDIQADLLLGNNVLAHVPDLNDFVAGMKIILRSSGVITMEFPHLLNLIQQNQFDTIYHEHFSYFSCLAVEKVFTRHGLTLFDVEEIPTHGGSLRIYVKHQENNVISIEPTIAALKAKEIQAGLDKIETYTKYSTAVQATKRKLLAFLIAAKDQGKTVAGYGAPAKGNTLLNYCGIQTDLLAYTVDMSPHKQGMFLPGTHIPIYAPEHIAATKPDYLLILPWNLQNEIIEQMAIIRTWGGKFVVPIPEVTVIP
jgi:2-polyprenyl-3-methyl-5-hydroxy-6-metoxy-1,4-benzoquinol methylase